MITISHKDAITVFPRGRFHIVDNIYFENGGFFSNTRVVARLFTEDEIAVSPGDTICCDGDGFSVIAVRDNRKNTTVPHWKIIARG